MHRVVAVALGVSLALVTASCGSDDEGGGGGGDDAVASAGAPCAEVWVDGGTLPDDYESCEEADGSTAAPVVMECSDGSSFTTYDDRFHASFGGTITKAGPSSASYTKAYEDCIGP
jgi:hypothetical protein